MTISEAISEADELKPNQYTDVHKLRWLNEIELKIKNELLDTHIIEDEDEEEDTEFEPYTEETDYDTELTAKAPYDGLYTFYLMAMIDFYNGETTKYANNQMMFNTKYSEYANYINRTYRHKGPMRMGV